VTPLAKVLRNAWEKMFGTFNEGPKAPPRLAQLVTAFAAGNPKATRREWGDFAEALANQAYREGWTRGWERSERDPDYSKPTTETVQEAQEQMSWIDEAPPFDAKHLDEEVSVDPQSLGARAYDQEQEAQDYFRWWQSENRAARGPRR
jgi:hypothetical protein